MGQAMRDSEILRMPGNTRVTNLEPHVCRRLGAIAATEAYTY